MKLKFYLRGLGIGVAVTALVMGLALSGNKKGTMTDEEIKERAGELGMVEEGKVLAQPNLTQSDDATSASENEVTPTSAQKPTDTPAPTKTPEPKETPTPEPKETPTPEPTKTPTPEPTEAPTPEPTETPTPEPTDTPTPSPTQAPEEEKTEVASNVPEKNGKSVNISVSPGSGSETVSALLYHAGLVDSAEKYNEFLCGKGYDRKITTGDHMVPVGSSYEEIAEIMTTKN